jgi:hypothetical protein
MQQWFPFMMQVGIDQNAAQNMWWQTDADRSGTLSQQEFLNLCNRPDVAPRIQQLEGQMGPPVQGQVGVKLFQHIDGSDGQQSGSVTFQQWIPHILRTGIDQNTAQQLWWQTDQDRSGTLSQQEFLNLCNRPDVSFRIQQVEAQLGGGGGMGGGGMGGMGGGMGFPRRNVIWGVNVNDEIYHRVWADGAGSPWKKIDGSLKAIAVSHDGLSVWGVNAGNNIYFRAGITPQDTDGTGWTHVDGSLESIAVTGGIALGSNSQNDIWARGGIGPQSLIGAGWSKIDGSLTQVALGPNGEFAGCNAQDGVWWRTGASLQNPQGQGWQNLDGALTCIAIGQDSYIWGTNRGHNVYHRAGVHGAWQHDASGPASWIATTANGFTVKVAPDHSVHHRFGPQGQWQQMDGQLKNVAVGCL